MSLLSTLVLLTAPGCGGSGADDDLFSGTQEPVSTGVGEATSEDSTTASGTTGQKLDIGSTGGGTGTDEAGGDPGCKKVDVLYIIDNSPSMWDEQQTLIANFGNFVTDMQTALADVDDYHIGVITTDNYVDEGIFDDSSPTVNADAPVCRILGGLVVDAQSGDCRPFAEGGNYITNADDLSSKFSCIANVGEDGDSDERVRDALINALNPNLANPGACNEGFIRSDALLIVVILTDENDPSNASNQEAYDAVVAAKGTADNVVMLGLTWDDGNNNCSSDLSESNGWEVRDFVDLFPNSANGNICDSSYAGFFSSAIPTIEGACDTFVPVD